MAALEALDAQPLFADPNVVAAFPEPIGRRLATMVHEIEHSGEETTPDETALAIDATLSWLGRVWFAEYLAAVAGGHAANEQLNRELFERIVDPQGKKPPLLGQWVGIARQVRAALHGVRTVVEGLETIDFGALGDETHPVARLVVFRNEFAHGSFHAPRARIREHRQLLHDLLERLPALRSQPVLCLDPESKTVREARGLWPIVDERERLPAGHPVIFATDRTRRLDLYPLLRASFDELRLEEPAKTAYPLNALAEQEALSVWLERYRRERAGFLAWPPVARPRPAFTDAELDPIRARIGSAAPGLMLVEVRPGCGSTALVDACAPEDPLELGLARYSATARVAVREGDPSQSGLTVALAALRLIERALGETLGARLASEANVLQADGPLNRAARDLASSGKRVLLALDGIHEGITPYRGESLTLLRTYEALARTPVDVIATCPHGAIAKPVYDARFTIEAAATLDLDDVRRAARACARTPMHLRVLRALVALREPVDLFTLCDALEAADGGSVFEPAVERALWDLRPVLASDRGTTSEGDEAIRTWRIFAEEARGTLREVTL